MDARLRLRRGRALGPGQFVTVEPGTAHRFWNAGDEPVTFVCEIRPALQFESLLETMFALAADGKTNRKGMPNLLRLAVIANAHFDTVRLPFPPSWLQRAGLVLGAPVGRLLGFQPTYARRPAMPCSACPVLASGLEPQPLAKRLVGRSESQSGSAHNLWVAA